MYYIQRDEQGKVIRVENAPFAEMHGRLPSDSDEIRLWLSDQTVEESLDQLRQSDHEMVRVLEDLIDVLIHKGVISITDLPPAAQGKLLQRTRARDTLCSLNRLIGEDEHLI